MSLPGGKIYHMSEREREREGGGEIIAMHVKKRNGCFTSKNQNRFRRPKYPCMYTHTCHENL